MSEMNSYLTFVFDCDGVVLNSNKIKTQAFYDVTKVYGHEAAQALKDYHVQNGGISRYAKFTYFITGILGKALVQVELDELLNNFACEVNNALLTCDVAEGIDKLRERTRHAKWLIVSGGDQEELREVFAARGLDNYFDGGIFGSPDTKDTILEREINNGNILKPALFLGDSQYDYQAAQAVGLNFLFLSKWTEVKDHQTWCETNRLCVKRELSELLFLFNPL
ncbi:MAG: HAD hydrolase-like protein [Methylovulum sp.]|nr:HAD hydrolase-like protein [Methylovulum sp.]MCF8000042.1 HAD hydrolase-like protein [Methylovulum sp.]MCF8007674.1 HAD hydrolase-like protein [Methylovulum sp.]